MKCSTRHVAVLFGWLISALGIGLGTAPTRAEEPGRPPTVAEGAELVVIFEDDRFFEGPTWEPNSQTLYFTAFGDDNQQILRYDPMVTESDDAVTVFKDQTEGVNGTFLAKDGRILGAQAYGHRLLAYEPDGETEVLLHDPSLNQPNDVCQSPDGTIYFSDPDFGDRKTSAVYRLSEEGDAVLVIDDLPTPNGLICSNDGQTLYVGDSFENRWYAYPIADDGSVGPGALFFDPDVPNEDSPDGMSIDEQGNLYFSGRGGVWVVSAEGQALGRIDVPEFCSNVTFGGPEHRTLYLTCRGRVYALTMTVRGGPSAGAFDRN